MWAIEELTIEDLEGRRIWDRLGRRAARSLGRKMRIKLIDERKEINTRGNGHSEFLCAVVRRHCELLCVLRYLHAC